MCVSKCFHDYTKEQIIKKQMKFFLHSATPVKKIQKPLILSVDANSEGFPKLYFFEFLPTVK